MLRKLFSDDLIRHSTIVSAGYMTSAVIGLVSFIIIARILGPGDFGLFSVALGVFVLTVDLLDSGLNSSIVKFLAKAGSEKNIQAILTLKLLLSGLFIVLAIPGGFVLASVLKNQALFYPITLAFASVGTSLLFNFVVFVFQAKKQFGMYSAINIASNSLRLILVLVFVVYLKLNPLYTSLFLYFFSPPLCLLFFYPQVLPLFKTINLKLEPISKSMWVFGRNLTGSFALSALSSKLDLFFLTRFSGVIQTGLYSAPMRLFSPVSQLSGALATVYGPHFASSEGAWKNIFIKAIGLSFLMATGLVVISFFSKDVLLIFGPTYQSSQTIFKILCFSFAIFALSAPFYSSIVYHQGNSRGILLNSVILCVVTAVSLYLLVPNYGGIGAAWASLISSATSTTVQIIIFLFAFRSPKKLT